MELRIEDSKRKKKRKGKINMLQARTLAFFEQLQLTTVQKHWYGAFSLPVAVFSSRQQHLVS